MFHVPLRALCSRPLDTMKHPHDGDELSIISGIIEREKFTLCHDNWVLRRLTRHSRNFARTSAAPILQSLAKPTFCTHQNKIQILPDGQEDLAPAKSTAEQKNPHNTKTLAHILHSLTASNENPTFGMQRHLFLSRHQDCKTNLEKSILEKSMVEFSRRFRAADLDASRGSVIFIQE